MDFCLEDDSLLYFQKLSLTHQNYLPGNSALRQARISVWKCGTLSSFPKTKLHTCNPFAGKANIERVTDVCL
jgi:hypothetical protein